MTTQGDKTTPTVEAEYASIATISEKLGLPAGTVKSLLCEWRAAGKIGKLKRKYHLPTVRRLALAASFKSD